MDHGHRAVADWQLERLALGELDEAAARDIERRLGADRTGERLRALQASSEEILARLPPETVGPAIRLRMQRRRASGRLLMALLPVAATVGVWTLGPLSHHPAAPRGQGEERILIKGATGLLAYRAVGTRAVRLGDAAPARAHDLVQLAYTSGEARFGMILSLDGRGVVTQHLPESPGRGPAPLAATGEVRLPRAYELDDAPGFERFILVAGPRPFSAAEVLAAARALAQTPGEARWRPLPLPSELSQHSFLLEKVGP
jgi:hypothetical protein